MITKLVKAKSFIPFSPLNSLIHEFFKLLMTAKAVTRAENGF